MKIKVKFPLPLRSHGLPGAQQNFKAIRESILLDTTGNRFESAIFQAAERAAGPDQSVFVSRTYGPAGRFSVWIVDESTGKKRLDRRKALQQALGSVRV